MNTRLEQFLAAENISQSQFADTIDVARASVSHILAGRNKPGWDFLNNMLKHYPNLNIEWLLNGTGKMYKSAARETTVKQEPSSAGSLQCCRIARHGESGFNQGVRNPARIEYSRTASHGVTEYANPTDAADR